MIRLLLLALLCQPLRAGEPDGLNRLETDPSPAATRELGALYRKIKNPDQRFWLVEALGIRLKERGDEAALRTLLAAATDTQANVRAPALRALEGFSSVPDEALRKVWLERLNAAAAKGAKDSAPAVRHEAADLQRALRDWGHLTPASRSGPAGAPSDSEGGFSIWLERGMGLLWLLLAPLIALLWFRMGLPVFDAAREGGRRASEAWRALARKKAFLLFSLCAWLCLVALVAGYGFDVLARLAGEPLYEVSSEWFLAYAAAGLCVFLPGALAASCPDGLGAVDALCALPRCAGLGLAVFCFFLPVEAAYRFLWRKAGAAERAESFGRRAVLAWVLEKGSLRAAYLALGVMAREGHGLGPAWRRAMELLPAPSEDPKPLGITIFNSHFAFLCAGPVLAFFCVLVARAQPVQWLAPLPVVLMGCVLWAWAVLGGALFSISQALDGIESADVLSRAFAGGKDDRTDQKRDS